MLVNFFAACRGHWRFFPPPSGRHKELLPPLFLSLSSLKVSRISCLNPRPLPPFFWIEKKPHFFFPFFSPDFPRDFSSCNKKTKITSLSYFPPPPPRKGRLGFSPFSSINSTYSSTHHFLWFPLFGTNSEYRGGRNGSSFFFFFFVDSLSFLRTRRFRKRRWPSFPFLKGLFSPPPFFLVFSWRSFPLREYTKASIKPFSPSFPVRKKTDCSPSFGKRVPLDMFMDPHPGDGLFFFVMLLDPEGYLFPHRERV